MKTAIAKLIEATKETRGEEIARMNFFKVFSIPKVSPAEFYHSRSFALWPL
jgi:hypothetical protein